MIRKATKNALFQIGIKSIKYRTYSFFQNVWHTTIFSDVTMISTGSQNEKRGDILLSKTGTERLLLGKEAGIERSIPF